MILTLGCGKSQREGWIVGIKDNEELGKIISRLSIFILLEFASSCDSIEILEVTAVSIVIVLLIFGGPISLWFECVMKDVKIGSVFFLSIWGRPSCFKVLVLMNFLYDLHTSLTMFMISSNYSSLSENLMGELQASFLIGEIVDYSWVILPSTFWVECCCLTSIFIHLFPRKSWFLSSGFCKISRFSLESSHERSLRWFLWLKPPILVTWETFWRRSTGSLNSSLDSIGPLTFSLCFYCFSYSSQFF